MITQKELQELTFYDPLTGVFCWRVSSSRCRRVKGQQFGSVNAYGYLTVTINRRSYMLHRLAWMYVHGRWPVAQIDHLGARDDNRLVMLREATHFQNEQHRGKNSNNKSGYKGVCWCKYTNKWRATISADGEYNDLGRFKNKEVAALAYLLAARELHGKFARLV